MKHTYKKQTLLLSFIALCSLPVVASDSYEEVSYTSLIEELSTRQPPKSKQVNSFDDVLIHLGIGFINSILTLSHEPTTLTKVVPSKISETPQSSPGTPTSGNANTPPVNPAPAESKKDPTPPVANRDNTSLKTTPDTVEIVTGEDLTHGQITVPIQGIQLSLGIDLFSDNWLAEGTLRSYDETRYRDAIVSLREFDLKIVYRSYLDRYWKMRAGTGIAARYLDIVYNEMKFEHTTPSSIFFVGSEVDLNSTVSFGAEVSRRSTLVSDTADTSAYDITVRLDSHF